MDKISTFLTRLSQKEKLAAADIIARIVAHDLSHLDVKKLKGAQGLFRVRKGDLRVIFQKTKNTIFILSVERRSDITYK
jgi:mRNA-degrading endonuclease RelE of RelBE toxin-antitoxin system